ncbi:MAG: peptidoglycan bridge formation glycyltransferase FemA/FemB family protein [Geminicoccaceae bacterium]
MIAAASLDLPVTLPGEDRTSPGWWDAFVASAPGGDIVQTSAWARAKEALGYESEVVTVERGGAIVGGGLLLIRRLAPRLRIGLLPRGPVLGSDEPELADKVLAMIVQAARRRGVVHLLVQPPADGPELGPALRRLGFSQGGPAIATSATIVSDLTGGRDTVLAALAPSRRRRLRRAAEQGVSCWTGDAADLELFHDLHSGTARRHGFAALSLPYLRAHWEALAPVGGCALILAGRNGRVSAARWLTAHGETVTGRLSGWNGDDRHLHAPLVSAWGAVDWAIHRGFRQFDFGGIDRTVAAQMLAGTATPDLLQRSAAAFKADFGGSPRLFPPTWQLCLIPVLRPLAHRLVGRMAEPGRMRGVLTRLRNGHGARNA